MSKLTSITNSLDHITGGRGGRVDVPAPALEQQRQWSALEGCLKWARGSGEGSAERVSMCNQEYVRRYWDQWGAEGMRQ